MVLVDTSVWIDFLQGGASPESQVLKGLIASEKDIAICGLIRQEVLQGIRDDLSLKKISDLFNQANYLPIEEPQSFDEAAAIYRRLRREGRTLRTPMDCLIAAIAIRYQVLLLHRDRDFFTISKVTTLKLF